MIGLVDYDLQTSQSLNLVPPNLEIMKLATYYRTEENLFCRLINLNETELSEYQKIYFFSESDNNIKIPDQFLRVNNIIFGGSGFTGKRYIPFENEIIDYTIPRPHIYKEYLKQKYQDGIKTKVIEHVLDDSYYRCYAGNNKLPIPPMITKKRVFLYDRDFFYSDWQDIIQEIINRKPSVIIRIHPIYCKTLEQYFNMRSVPKLSRSNEVILDLDIPFEEIPYMLRKYANRFLADFSQQSNIYLTLGGDFKTSFQYYKDFIYKINLLYSFWSKNIPIKIKYINPSTGVVDVLQPLSESIATWSKSPLKDRTINDKIVLKNKKQISPAHEARDLLLKFHPSVKDLFNQTYNSIVKRGYWRL